MFIEFHLLRERFNSSADIALVSIDTKRKIRLPPQQRDHSIHLVLPLTRKTGGDKTTRNNRSGSPLHTKPSAKKVIKEPQPPNDENKDLVKKKKKTALQSVSQSAL